MVKEKELGVFFEEGQIVIRVSSKVKTNEEYINARKQFDKNVEKYGVESDVFRVECENLTELIKKIDKVASEDESAEKAHKYYNDNKKIAIIVSVITFIMAVIFQSVGRVYRFVPLSLFGLIFSVMYIIFTSEVAFAHIALKRIKGDNSSNLLVYITLFLLGSPLGVIFCLMNLWHQDRDSLIRRVK